MATLFITEYSYDGNADGITAMNEPNNAEQNVAIGVSSTQSATLKNNTQYVRLMADTICSVAFGTNPTAVGTAHRLPANVIEYVQVPVSSGWKIATIN